MKIVHLADIHIRKSPLRHQEYRDVFQNLYKSILFNRPDRIVIVGDIFHEGIKFESEQIVLASEFINNLSRIAPVRIIRGNHDINKYALKRIDAIDALLKAINNHNVKYYNDTAFFEDEEIVWAVYKHGDKNNNPWTKFKGRIEGKTYIDLYHDPVNGSTNGEGFVFKSKTHRAVDNFRGDISMFGDIHMFQTFGDTKAYSSSLIAQNFAEGDDQFHGYLLWDTATKTFEKFSIKNDYSYKNVTLTRFTDFDALDFEIEEPTPYMRVRVTWNTYPASKNSDNERKVIKYLEDKYKPISVKHKAEFVEDQKKITAQNTADIANLHTKEVVHEIFRTHLTDQGETDDVIQEVIDLDDEIESRIQLDDLNNILWSIVRFYGKNFRSFKELEIDWKDKDGMYQISGLNTAGKSSLLALISYILYGKSAETDFRKKHGDARFINNVLNVDFCEGGLVLDCSGEYYGIKRKTQTKKNKIGELTEAKTTVEYYKLATPDDDFVKENNLDSLNEEERRKTQKRIDEIIGSYDNFVRIILTSADTLNTILSNDKSIFVDALLNDAGLNVFELRLQEFKQYRKDVIAPSKVNCDVNKELSEISRLEDESRKLNTSIGTVQSEINVCDDRIVKGEKFKEETFRTLHKIEIDPNETEERLQGQIQRIEGEIRILHAEKEKLDLSISKLRESFDEQLLSDLIRKKDEHLTSQFQLKNDINKLRLSIEKNITAIQKINGEIFLAKKEGSGKRDELARLEKAKVCPTCGQQKNQEAIVTIAQNMEKLKSEMIALGELIKTKEIEKLPIEQQNASFEVEIKNIENKITSNDVEFNNILLQIGELKNQENEVKRRNELTNQANIIPIKIQNKQYEKDIHEKKLTDYYKEKEKILENKKIQATIDKAVEKINELKINKQTLERDKMNKTSQIKVNDTIIANKYDTINKFKEQERRERVYELYLSCVHRDGIPTQILRTILLPKINDELNSLLANVDFNVWLDAEELRPKMAYNSRPQAIIDCISSSGKERTFSSLSMKMALNEINAKSKPTMFMLDEVTGKLDNEGSVEEFVELLQTMKLKAKKLLIIEHNHDMNPDYVIHVSKNADGISSLTMA
jgi:DNA repair exonuclease SbcCD ATPase subunit